MSNLYALHLKKQGSSNGRCITVLANNTEEVKDAVKFVMNTDLPKHQTIIKVDLETLQNKEDNIVTDIIFNGLHNLITKTRKVDLTAFDTNWQYSWVLNTQFGNVVPVLNYALINKVRVVGIGPEEKLEGLVQYDGIMQSLISAMKIDMSNVKADEFKTRTSVYEPSSFSHTDMNDHASITNSDMHTFHLFIMDVSTQFSDIMRLQEYINNIAGITFKDEKIPRAALIIADGDRMMQVRMSGTRISMDTII